MHAHFINLTNGLPCYYRIEGPVHYTRLQSTACEQHLWGDVLRDLGADFYMHLALGYTIVFHDKSECKPQPRAYYQGIAWVRYALGRAWFHRPTDDVFVKGVNCVRYFYLEYNKLHVRDRKRLTYYRKWVHTASVPPIVLCSEYEGAHK